MASDWTNVDLGLDWDIQVLVDVIDGRPRLMGLRMEPGSAGTPISADVLRTFPIRAALASAVDASVSKAHILASESGYVRGAPLPEEHLAQVRAAYDLAVSDGISPIQFIQGTWGVTRPTAYNWIRRANADDDNNA